MGVEVVDDFSSAGRLPAFRPSPQVGRLILDMEDARVEGRAWKLQAADWLRTTKNMYPFLYNGFTQAKEGPEEGHGRPGAVEFFEGKPFTEQELDQCH